MAFVLKNASGHIVAVSPSLQVNADWEAIDDKDIDYLHFLDQELKKHHTFRESDIQLARVLEDLISIMIDRSLISFTDFPSAAQKRLNERQTLRRENSLSALFGDDDIAKL